MSRMLGDPLKWGYCAVGILALVSLFLRFILYGKSQQYNTTKAFFFFCTESMASLTALLEQWCNCLPRGLPGIHLFRPQGSVPSPALWLLQREKRMLEALSTPLNSASSSRSIHRTRHGPPNCDGRRLHGECPKSVPYTFQTVDRLLLIFRWWHLWLSCWNNFYLPNTFSL